MKQLYFETRADWREWLATHHNAEKQGAWLIFYRIGSGHPTLDYDEAVEEALCFGWIDSIIRKIDEQKYCRKFTPRREGSRWSRSNKRRVARLIKSGQMTPAGLAVVRKAKMSGTWNAAPPSETRFDLPEELAEALRRHETARMHFDELARSYRKQFIGWIASAKRPETRSKRVAKSIELLERGEKLGMR